MLQVFGPTTTTTGNPNPLDEIYLLGILYVLVGMLLLVIFFWFLRKLTRRYKKIAGSFRKRILVLTVPKYETDESARDESKQEVQEAISAMETVYGAIGGLRAQRGAGAWFFGREDQLSFELVVIRQLIYFYLAVPDYLKSFLEEQIQAQFPNAHLEEVSDYNIFSKQGVVRGGYLTLKKMTGFPLKTYLKMDGDPLNAVTNTLSKLPDEAGAAIQLVVRSAKRGWRKPGLNMVRAMQQGKKMSEALAESNTFKRRLAGFFDFFSDLFSTKSKAEQSPKETYRLTPVEEEMVKGVEEKANKAGLDVNLRVVVSANDSHQATTLLDNIMNAFSQYNIYEYGNHLQRKSANQQKLINDFIYRHFSEKYAMVLNTEELTSLYHFPMPSVTTPNIFWLSAKKAPPPAELPDEGIILGVSEYRGVTKTVRMKMKDRQRHTYIIGKSGVGKSVLMQNMCIQDIQEGRGVCIIDPHGDLVEHILTHVPKERAEDVILFDPADTARPLALNMLEYDTPEQKTFVINEMIQIFDKLYDLKSTGGPMFEQYMRNAMLLIMDDPTYGASLMDIPRVLSDEDFRRVMLDKCHNQLVIDFWTKEAEKAGGEAALANIVPYITSKLTPFITNDIMRPIISQPKSAFKAREVMDQQKILLINLSKGKVGDINSNLLGMVMVGKILIAALGRVNLPEEERKDFYLYIDEFQNFITESIAVILSEARKYRLDLIIAHQYIGQLVKNNDSSIRDAVFGNVGTTVSFRIGIEDAEMLAKQFAPVFSEYDVVNIPKYQAYIKLLIDNENPPAFNMKTLPPQEGNLELAAKIRELARLKFGRDKAIVEAEIQDKWRNMG